MQRDLIEKGGGREVTVCSLAINTAFWPESHLPSNM